MQEQAEASEYDLAELAEDDQAGEGSAHACKLDP